MKHLWVIAIGCWVAGLVIGLMIGIGYKTTEYLGRVEWNKLIEHYVLIPTTTKK